MAFGPKIPVHDGDYNRDMRRHELELELAPYSPDELSHALEGLDIQSSYESWSPRFIEMDEYEETYLWGVWLYEGDTRTLIGIATLVPSNVEPRITAKPDATMFEPRYREREDIFLCAHKALMYFAFNRVRVMRLVTSVIGLGSSRSSPRGDGLETIGYIPLSSRHEFFRLSGQMYYQCLTANVSLLDNWYAGEDWRKNATEPTKYMSARQRVIATIDWGLSHVEIA